MEKNKRMSKGKYILASAAVFLCLFMAGNASATDGTTFPVDKADISAYVKVSESIDLEDVLSIFPYGHVEVLNETYVIGTVQNADDIWTHLYIGADGWVIPYYLNTEHASHIVRWNESSAYDPTPENVTAMNTLEEIISRVCPYLGVDYETIKPEIKYYDFEYPDATNMTVIVDIAQNVSLDTFKLWIPSEFIESVNESSFSHYTDGGGSDLYLDGLRINSVGYYGHPLDLEYRSLFLSFNYFHEIEVTNIQLHGSDYRTSGVGWVLVYTKKP